MNTDMKQPSQLFRPSNLWTMPSEWLTCSIWSIPISVRNHYFEEALLSPSNFIWCYILPFIRIKFLHESLGTSLARILWGFLRSWGETAPKEFNLMTSAQRCSAIGDMPCTKNWPRVEKRICFPLGLLFDACRITVAITGKKRFFVYIFLKTHF